MITNCVKLVTNCFCAIAAINPHLHDTVRKSFHLCKSVCPLVWQNRTKNIVLNDGQIDMPQHHATNGLSLRTPPILIWFVHYFLAY